MDMMMGKPQGFFTIQAVPSTVPTRCAKFPTNILIMLVFLCFLEFSILSCSTIKLNLLLEYLNIGCESSFLSPIKSPNLIHLHRSPIRRSAAISPRDRV
jgi:hypothetical protein